MLNAMMLVAYVILIPVQHVQTADEYARQTTSWPYWSEDQQAQIEWTRVPVMGDTITVGMVKDPPCTYTAIVCLDETDVGAYLQHNKVPDGTLVLDVKTGRLLVPVQTPVMTTRQVEEFSHYKWSVEEAE